MMDTTTKANTAFPSVNQVLLQKPDEILSAEEVRQRAHLEMLRQTAIKQGLLPTDDQPVDYGVISEAASRAIELLLDQKINAVEPSEENCLRHYSANKSTYSTGEKLRLRHILLAVTDGVDVNLLRLKAEEILLELKCKDSKSDEINFGEFAKKFSNCPSAMNDGDLGWLTPNDCVPEFGKAVFGNPGLGILPKLTSTRFGFHIVEVLEREPGSLQPFSSVKGAVVTDLRQQDYVNQVRHYLFQLKNDFTLADLDLEL